MEKIFQKSSFFRPGRVKRLRNPLNGLILVLALILVSVSAVRNGSSDQALERTPGRATSVANAHAPGRPSVNSGVRDMILSGNVGLLEAPPQSPLAISADFPDAGPEFAAVSLRPSFPPVRKHTVVPLRWILLCLSHRT